MSEPIEGEWNPEELHEFLEWAPKQIADLVEKFQRIAERAKRTDHPDAERFRRTAYDLARQLDALNLNVGFVKSLDVDAHGFLSDDDNALLDAYEKFNEDD